MCGIVGYIGERNAGPLLIDGLKRLEYRGYDSAGIATLNNNEITLKKDIGKIDEIEKNVELSKVEGESGICHCRWATHGSVTKENAHPHCNKDQSLSLVHNGIIENHAQLRKQLEEKGYVFESDTDTETIIHLIDSHYQGDLKGAVISALREVEGSYAIALISKKHPDMLIAARNESPLIIGLADKENFIASDVTAILANTRKVMYLNNKEVCVLTKDTADIFDLEGSPVARGFEQIEWDATKAEKAGFDHFMLKEIFEQPDVITDTVDGRIADDEILLNQELKDIDCKSIKRIVIVACGTSWHAGLIGEFMIEELAKIPVEVEYASEFRYRDPIIEEGTLVIAISQSGETADTLAAMREAKKKNAKILSVVNVTGSSIARESDTVLYTKAGPEIGVASTKAFTSQVIMLYLLTVYLADKKEVIDKQQVKNRIRDIRRLPLQIQTVLDDKEFIKKQAQEFTTKVNALYLGRGINFPIALEGALKLKEVSYVHAEGYPAAEMKHGPIALIDKQMPVVVIATKDDRTYAKVLSNIEEVRARGGIIIAITTKGEDDEVRALSKYCIHVPKNSYILTPLLATIPLQLFAYYTAVLKGFDPDKPKNLAKSVTVE